MAAAVGMSIFGAILNATAFTGGNVLAQTLSGQGETFEKERERHDRALEKFNRDTEKYREQRELIYDWKKKQQSKEYEAERELSITDDDLKLYSEVTQERSPKFSTKLMSEPKFNDYYSPSDEQKQWEKIYVAAGLIGGVFLFL